MAVLRPRKEIHQIHNAVFVDIPGLQDIGGRKVLLLRGEVDSRSRRDAEVSALVLVEKSAEDGRRIEVGPEAVSYWGYSEFRSKGLKLTST